LHGLLEWKHSARFQKTGNIFAAFADVHYFLLLPATATYFKPGCASLSPRASPAAMSTATMHRTAKALTSQ
jgi:hypothetical protein